MYQTRVLNNKKERKELVVKIRSLFGHDTRFKEIDSSLYN